MPKGRQHSTAALSGVMTMTEQFRADVRDVLKRHSADLDADDLRALADDLEATAAEWEGVASHV